MFRRFLLCMGLLSASLSEPYSRVFCCFVCFSVVVVVVFLGGGVGGGVAGGGGEGWWW